MKNQFNVWRIVRFLIVGSINASLSLGVYYLALHFMGLPYYAASALSVIFGVVVGFKAHGAFVFQNEGNFFRYIGIWFFIYLANTAAIWLIRPMTGDYWAPIILLPLVVLLSYVLMKKFIYIKSSTAV